MAHLYAFVVLLTALVGTNYARYHGKYFIKRADSDPEICHASSDIIFVLDESGSIWGLDFEKQIEFVKNITDEFEIGENATRIGVLTFGSDEKIQFQPNKYKEKDELKKALDRIHQRRGQTATHKALDAVYDSMLVPGVVRASVPQIVIVITDGESDDRGLTSDAAKRIKTRPGTTVFAIGIGRQLSSNKNFLPELRAIASVPPETHVMTANGYSDMESQLKDQLAWKTCHVPTLPPPTTTTTTEAPTTTQPQMMEGCAGNRPMDLIFTIPEHAGIEDTSMALDFIESVADEANMGDKTVKIGVAERPCSATRGVPLTGNKAKFYHDCDATRPTELGANIDLQISYLRDVAFSKQNGGREESAKIAVVLVDNVATEKESAQLEADAAKSHMKLVMIGVGSGVDMDQLRSLAAPGPVYRVKSYRDLPSIKARLIQALCRGLTDPHGHYEYGEDSHYNFPEEEYDTYDEWDI